MDRANSSDPAARRATARNLQGKTVLVKSTRDQRHPPTALRGFIEVRENAEGTPQFGVAVDFPQMFSTPAHHRTIPLDEAGLARLLASENNGTFEFTIDDELR